MTQETEVLLPSVTLNNVAQSSISPRPQKGVVATPLRFLKQPFFFFLLPSKLHQTLPGNHFYILHASFDVYGVKLGGVVWVWGSSKRMVEGVGEIPWFLFCPFLKYLTRYVLQTCYVDENQDLLTYSAKNPAKIPCFYDFLAKHWFLLIFTYILNASKFPRARWLYDVTVTSYEVQWYSFWYKWIEEVHTYTLVANIGVSGAFRIENPVRGLQHPSSENVLQKIPQEDEG